MDKRQTRLTFQKEVLDKKLSSLHGKKLGDPEVDVKHVFDRTLDNPKITGIAGDVIEQSVLGYPANSKQEPDIVIIDGHREIETEVKTTGVKKSKGDKVMLEAKEPMSITAVSIPTIGNEKFESSNFWHKIEHMLIIYYLYDSSNPIAASGYSEFPIVGHDFHNTNDVDKERLKNDWERVQQFIVDIQKNFNNPEEEYPRLSSALRHELLLIDTAPKYPNPPRFRLKRNYVTSIFQDYYYKPQEALPERITNYSDIDRRCAQYRKEYGGKTVRELAAAFGLELNPSKHAAKRNGIAPDVSKSICEALVVKMFGGKANKINKIEDFVKIGIIGKTVTLNPKGAKTEDMKVLPIDFDEIVNSDVNFEGDAEHISSTAYDFFAEHSFLCAVFSEKTADSPLTDNVFLGFKRVFFSEEFLKNDLRKTWNTIRSLVLFRELKESPVLHKDGTPVINPNGVVKTELNFPKKGRANSSDHNNVFVRGSGTDSSYKPETVNGISMYQQWIWLDGNYIVDKLSKEEYL